MMKYFPLLLVPLPGSVKYSQRMKSQTEQQGNREGINIIRKISNLPLSIFLSFSLSLSVYFHFFLRLSHSSSNTSKIKLHYTPLYWSFGTSRTAFSTCQRIQWLMAHGVLMKLFLFGQIILKM